VLPIVNEKKRIISQIITFNRRSGITNADLLFPAQARGKGIVREIP
jgi:hypothetical protein